ncbi:hypothetical protein MCUN1_001060 [Malassezia cuniculi]|uniref:Major facilitator superfamily (MFS) profile domain-containing protein n=1 Tax=Malassezia cuniculi TaxID=948313 RepID=A0AAF0EX14_9BASI|nr:hypothetical protein MCUN1_001060 [Malassezia cuniculi]
MLLQLPHFPGANRLRGMTLTCITAFICGSGFLLFGYDQGVMSALIEQPMLATTMPQIAKFPGGQGLDPINDPAVPGMESQFDSNIQGAIVGCYELGCMIGSLFVLWQGDTLGRRLSVCIGSIIMIIGTIVMVADDRLPAFTVGRVITGIGNGLDTATIPMLQSELSKASNRGLLVFVEGALLAGGVMVSYWIDYLFYMPPALRMNSVQWRFPIAFQAVLALILLCGIFIIPESPRWLVKKGHIEEAHEIISRMQGLPLDDPEVMSELNALRDSIEKLETAMGDFSYKEIVSMGPHQNFYRTVTGCCSQMFQQLTGINNLTYYCNTVFNMFVPDSTTARLYVCGSGVLYFVAASFAVFIIDLAGRRMLMMSCAFGMMICMAILSGAVYKCQQLNDLEKVRALSAAENNQLSLYGKLATAFIYLYFVPWSFGWLGMTWLYPPEITPIRIRAPASALSTTTNWIWNFTVVMISPPAFKNLRNHTFTMFGAFNLMFIPFVYMFFPETKRRGLEEMDLFFAEQHETGFWKASRFMTTACYLSITRPYLSSAELDEELKIREGEGKSDNNEYIERDGDVPQAAAA